MTNLTGDGRHLSDAWKRCLDPEGRPAAPVDWPTAVAPGDVRALGRWRGAVGPARVGNADPGRLPSDRGSRPPLAVAAWNASVGAGAIRALWDHLCGGHGVMAGPTVLLLQEVFAAGPHLPVPTASVVWARRIAGVPEREPRTDIVSFARAAGLSLVYVPSMRNGGPDEGAPEDRGSAILANVPLASPRAIELPFERQRRVAVAASVTLADHTIDLCSVHLENRAPWGRAWRGLGSGRRRQMAALLTVFPSTRADASVLGGDFNTWVGGRRESAYGLARERFPLPTQPDPRPTHHFEIGGRLRHSDHLMFRLPPGWPGDYRRLNDTFGSDHYPLLGTAGPHGASREQESRRSKP